MGVPGLKSMVGGGVDLGGILWDILLKYTPIPTQTRWQGGRREEWRRIRRIESLEAFLIPWLPARGWVFFHTLCNCRLTREDAGRKKNEQMVLSGGGGGGGLP